MTEGHAALDTAAYSRIYEAEYSRLCGYARTLTGNPWVAGDLVAEAHYSVWRRIRAGHPVGADAVPAELTSAVRALSAGVGNGGPSQQASYLEPLVQVLDELPQRWVKALWLAEVDGLPPEEVARRTGVSPDGAAALVERVRESVRQEFLRAQPGYPASAACGGYWEGLPGHVRGADSPHQAEQIAVHIDGCRDCRGRMEQLVAADDRLPALTGPALLALYDRDMARFLAPLAAAGAVGAVGAAGVGALATGGGAHAAPSNGPLVSSRRSMHHLVRGQVRQAGPVAVAAAAGGVLLVAGAAVMTGLALTDGGSAAAQQPAAASKPSISDTSDSADSSSPSAATSGASRHSEGSRAGVPGEASRNRPSTASVPTGHSPTDAPSSAVSPSRKAPTSGSSESPSSRPSSPSSSSASNGPSHRPTDEPTQRPTDGATSDPEGTPSGQPTRQPTDEPTQRPTAKPTDSGSDSGDSRGCVSLVVRLCVSR
ncbi:hypothetical protein [Streptomyces rapamycinicus]|uniref:Uncharacterized protein n=2 Tax=Streptomyces rapamycinicus TaxID=1226757 RepID=A0A0A0N9N8_STRRN|nr:hypothetical protein [Streptomyces rapamycinicus]AGP53891.1 hypothetical protein M271_11460 [Streptomyces rapamycinicus NRRL 5491]MBB4781381.1 DNA-directed RNA polymerase specialized sigma24 family protein [Streptomyces rapamycinicus]RLV73974.1 hypothetical protein D3C57_132150 [Streptomyces rapamycinicus NRRL 5491]UTO62003.1 hypothetical protein LJB45_06500 [Streptomyces rapamycinicus]UTP29955.1 hypothetical protein LIV37_11615 [Streptomyces rapamycinicus NRRL 5491]